MPESGRDGRSVASADSSAAARGRGSMQLHGRSCSAYHVQFFQLPPAAAGGNGDAKRGRKGHKSLRQHSGTHNARERPRTPRRFTRARAYVLAPGREGLVAARYAHSVPTVAAPPQHSTTAGILKIKTTVESNRRVLDHILRLSSRGGGIEWRGGAVLACAVCVHVCELRVLAADALQMEMLA